MPVARFATQLHLEHRGRYASLVLGLHAEGDPAALQHDPAIRDAMAWLVRPLDSYLLVDGGADAGSPVTLTVGWQRLGWGEGGALSPLDLDPKDVRLPGLLPFGRTPLSRLATRVAFRRGRHLVEITGVHEARFDLRPAPFDGLSPFRAPALDALGPLAPLAFERDVRWVDRPAPFARQNQQLFARYAYRGPRATLGLHAASLLDPLGVVRVDEVDLSGERVDLPLDHPRFGLVGASLAIPLGPVVARGELVLDVARSVNVRASENAMDVERRTLLRGALGLRWQPARGGLVDVEYGQGASLGVEGPPMLWPFAAPNLALRVVQPFLRERIEAELVVLITGRHLRGGAFARAELSYRPADAFQVALGGAVFLEGPERSVLDGFGREDRIYVRLAAYTR
ncbi:MAG: hypothetical protein KF901_22620 [Myxococcales bacterium]|nr:hypothetical protein [Myxococcales bacterium]